MKTCPERAFILRMLAYAPMIWYDMNFDASQLWQGVAFNPIGANIIWNSIFSDYNPRLGLGKINCPVFLGLGRYDYWNPPHLWETYRNDFKNSTLRIFEKSGHTPSLEEPRLFDIELKKWINKTIINQG